MGKGQGLPPPRGGHAGLSCSRPPFPPGVLIVADISGSTKSSFQSLGLRLGLAALPEDGRTQRELGQRGREAGPPGVTRGSWRGGPSHIQTEGRKKGRGAVLGRSRCWRGRERRE